MRGLWCGRDYLDLAGGEHHVERGGELGVPVRIRWVNPRPASARSALSSRASCVAQAAVGNRVVPGNRPGAGVRAPWDGSTYGRVWGVLQVGAPAADPD